MVIGKAKHVIKEQDSTLEGKRNQKCTKFSVCVQVKSTLRRANISEKLYQAPRKLSCTVHNENVQKELWDSDGILVAIR